MSRIGIISQKYKNTAKLFQKINNATITFKKDVYSSNNVSLETVENAKYLLAGVLSNILRQFEDDSSDFIFNEEEIKELQLELQKSEKLDNNFLDLLDKICIRLDAETSILYRKMRRR